MLWTIFKFLIVVWMLQMVLEFGASGLRLMLAVSFVALVLRLIIHHTAFNSDGLHCATYNQFTWRGPEAILQKNATHPETGRFNSATIEQFAGAAKSNSSLHNRIYKEQHL
jgi:hypothetical protein